jgi:hypothetical protein
MIRSLIIPYRATRYDFHGLVQRAMKVGDLTQLHTFHQYSLFKLHNDQNTMWHDRFYTMTEFDTLWKIHYVEFVRWVQEIVGEPIVYQRIPTFRVHLPGNIAVAEAHRDRDYHHSPDEVNVWVPLTDAFDTTAVWLETRENSLDFRPLELQYGQVAFFDGANLRHMNKPNLTDKTRVSFDLRYVPLSIYRPRSASTFNTKLPMRLPDYDQEKTYWALVPPEDQ